MIERSYSVVVEEVHSGDDLVLMVDLGIDGLFKRTRARLKGVDTPSAYRIKGDTEAGALRDRLRGLVRQGACTALVHVVGKGGWLVTLFVDAADGSGRININDMLIQQGYVYRNKAQDTP